MDKRLQDIVDKYIVKTGHDCSKVRFIFVNSGGVFVAAGPVESVSTIRDEYLKQRELEAEKMLLSR